MTNTEIYHAIHACVSRLTDTYPDIRFRENSSNILISWQGSVPDEVTTSIIEETLKQFGNPIPHHFRDANCVSFVILR